MWGVGCNGITGIEVGVIEVCIGVGVLDAAEGAAAAEVAELFLGTFGEDAGIIVLGGIRLFVAADVGVAIVIKGDIGDGLDGAGSGEDDVGVWCGCDGRG